jgi:hypothetical protein
MSMLEVISEADSYQEERFQSVLGSRRGAERAYAALLSGKRDTCALAQTATLIAQIQTQQFDSALSLLAQADRGSNHLLLEVANALASAFADRAPASWAFSAALALRIFGFANNADQQLPHLHADAQELWETECGEGLQADVENRLRDGGLIDESWLQERAIAVARGGLVWALAHQCKHAPAQHLETLLDNGTPSFQELQETLWGLDYKRECTPEEFAARFGVGDWMEVTELWVSQTPQSASEFARLSAPHIANSGREDLANDLHTHVLNACVRGYPNE